MKKLVPVLGFILVLLIGCSSADDGNEVEENLNASDCELTLSSDPNIVDTAICLNGAEAVSKNQTLTYASKFASISNGESLTIVWKVESGAIEILDIENSVQNGLRKSVASLKFGENFSGGSINVKGIDGNTGDFATMSYNISAK